MVELREDWEQVKLQFSANGNPSQLRRQGSTPDITTLQATHVKVSLELVPVNFRYPRACVVPKTLLVWNQFNWSAADFMRESIWPLCQQQLTFGLGNIPYTVEAFLTNTLVSGQLLCLRSPSQDPVFLNSHTNSVFFHSRKRPAPVTNTFFRVPRVPAYESFHRIFSTLIIHTPETFQHGASGITRRSDKNQKFNLSIGCRPPRDTFAKKMRR